MMNWKIPLTLALLLLPVAGNALKFHSYVNENGETVFSNVPLDCVKNSALTCMKYHPVLSSENNKKPPARTTQKRPDQSNKRPTQGATAGSATNRNQTGTTTIAPGLNLGTLQQIVEMNQLVDEYFPGSGDPEMVQQVRQQQQNILQVLEAIRGSASGEQQPTIDKAMEILRSNLAR